VFNERRAQQRTPFYFSHMDELVPLVRTEAVRRLRESQERIHKCLGLLSEAQVWQRPNAHVVSVGNLVLHLCGNIGQYINSTLGGRPDRRRRDDEFSAGDEEHANAAITKKELLERFDAVLAYAFDVINGLGEEQLVQEWSVQGFRESGLAIVIHVVEHASYHTGQISLHVKLRLDLDLGYYAGQDLNITS
jgi:uncharacterized damage-inducible protein DinB